MEPSRPSDADTARELAGVEAEPLLPAEKWLIGGSLALGIGPARGTAVGQ